MCVWVWVMYVCEGDVWFDDVDIKEERMWVRVNSRSRCKMKRGDDGSKMKRRGGESTWYKLAKRRD